MAKKRAKAKAAGKGPRKPNRKKPEKRQQRSSSKVAGPVRAAAVKAARRKTVPRLNVDDAIEVSGEEEAAASPLPPFLIVAIGASAGGLDAISQFLFALPRHVKFAMVVVQHLAPDHDSVLST